ncbi:MAG: GNAT family N-acetyltransferase [Desulfobacteraceae bacterium]|nr:MAG: GNAT family N-acetyltransferase [Desulfobacteraceae bacterium]
MYRFNIIPVRHLTESEMDCISAKLVHQPMGDMLLAWCRYIRETASNPLEIKMIRIQKNDSFLGIGILTIIHKLPLSNLMPSASLGKLVQWGEDRFRIPPFLSIGILGIPLMHRPGLLTFAPVSTDEGALIYTEMARFLRKHRLGMHALCICTDPSFSADQWMKTAGLISQPFSCRAMLDYPYKSFEEYYATLSVSKRKDIRRTKNVLQRYAGQIELSTDFQTLAGEVTKLFSNTADSKGGFHLIEIGKRFFTELSRLEKCFPRLILVRQEHQLVGFFLIFQSADTLYLKSCGLDYDLSLKMRAYFNLYYAAMEYAVKHNLTKIDCGLTTNYFKESKINCQLTPVTYWIDFYHWFFLPVKMIRKIFPTLIS